MSNFHYSLLKNQVKTHPWYGLGISILAILLAVYVAPLGWALAIFLERSWPSKNNVPTLIYWAKNIGMFLTIIWVGMIIYFNIT